MPLPSAATKANCDASTDDPKQALLTDLAGVIDTVNALITAIAAEYAALASPALTGNPTAPTQTAGNSSTRLATTAFVATAVAAIAKAAATRQSVLGGPVDSSGYPAPGGATGGTSLTTTAISASAPSVVGFANGFGSGGEVNLFGYSTANLAWTGLSTNGTMYLYVDYNAGGLTTGSTTLAPVYQNGGTYSTTSGQATFNITEMVMKVGDGAAANQTNRVFVGEVTVAGGVVTAVTWYAYRGRYRSPTTNTLPASATPVSANHNIGVQPRNVRFHMECISADLGYAVGDVYEGPPYSTTVSYGYPVGPYATSKVVGIVANSAGGVAWGIPHKSTGAGTAPTHANWAYYFTAERGW